MITIYLKQAEGKLSEAAHMLLHTILQEQYHIASPVECRAEAGKPYLLEGPYIGLSHCKGYVAVGVGDVPFGVDLESTGRRVAEGLAERVCSEGELQWYDQQGRTAEAFLTLWTLKESYYKYLGIGLPGFPNHTAFCYDGGWFLDGSSCRFDTRQIKTLRIAVCSNTEQKISYCLI